MINTVLTQTKQKKQVLSFSCTPELSNRINNICEHQGCTKSWLMTRALEEYLMELEEDLEDLKAAEKGWEKFVKDGCKGTTLDGLEVKLEL